ncbi:MAG: DUF1178 family protein [Niveispirillum sp.]
MAPRTCNELARRVRTGHLSVIILTNRRDMILFDLKCSQGHRFEGWFRNGAAYEAQAASHAITCPICGDARVEKAPMAPAIAKGGRSRDRDAPPPTAVADTPVPAVAAPVPMPDAVKEAQAEILRHLRDLRSQVEKNADYVGDRFAEEARKIHYGEVESRAIYGETSPEQAEALREEGVPVAAIPWLPVEN